MKLSSFTNPNAVTNLNASFPSLSLNPTTSSALSISLSAESCSSFSAVCMLGKICYTLRLYSVAENVNFCLSYSSHSMYTEPWFSVWLCPESLASLSCIYILVLHTNGCHCSDFSPEQLLCYWHLYAFPQGWRWFSWCLSCKLKSYVSPIMLFLIRESFLSPELHVDTRTLHCVTHISNLHSS